MEAEPIIPATHLLVVDDDDRLRALLKQYLGEQGHLVSTAANAREAEEILAVLVVDAVVLDVMMPGETGLSFCKRIKANDAAPPVLLLTARTEADDRIAGLETGADDYLAKPFAPRELLLRIQNILRRKPAAREAGNKIILFGESRFDLAAGQLTVGHESVYLTSSEIDCLRILAQRAGTPVSREQMAGLLGDVSNERSVDVQINRLRKKIEPNPAKPIYLQTIRHAGYVLYAKTEAI
jgi:two-component system phosphate regulon response regulator OmpR